MGSSHYRVELRIGHGNDLDKVAARKALPLCIFRLLLLLNITSMQLTIAHP
jgi:hypothetical protein